MTYEVTIRMLIETRAGLDRVSRQVESAFEPGTLRESIAEGPRLEDDPRLIDVAVAAKHSARTGHTAEGLD
jgi:hypothetical protein